MHKVVLVTGFLIVIAAIALSVQFSTTNMEFSRFNTNWNGTSDFFNLLEAHGAEEVPPADISATNDSLLLIIAPDTSFSTAEIAALKEFLSNGNTIFIADETGSGNSLLEGLGSRIRVIPGNISSIDMDFNDYWSVIAYTRKEDPILSNVSSITLNGPSSVTEGDILVSTSLLSWDDKNNNYYPDGDEPFSSFAILSRDSIRNGTLYVLSDPSIFINGMMEVPMKGDNEEFIENVLALHPRILVEQSHSMTAATDRTLAMGNWVKTTMVIKISILVLSILFAGVAFHRRWV
jgi:hypothetical protein